MSQVILEEIRKRYDADTEVIKGVSLSVAAGEFLVLVGPSGCGKSTLLRMIAGLESITSGSLIIGDRRVNDVPPRDRGVGMVFQSYALYPHMTVRENIGFGLKIRKMPAAQIAERVARVARMLDLEPYLARHPKNLSGGQRQRVAMGRAIAREPEVFLFDEPLSNLDAALRTQMRVELKKLHRELRSTMIYVTHDQIEAMTLADRIMILDQGVAQQIGTPTEIFERPRNRFVASFIGSPAMNFIDVSGAEATSPLLRFPGRQWPAHVSTLGVRPQRLHVALRESDVPQGHGIIRARVEVIEPMGWEAYLHLRALESGQALTAHLEMEALRGLKPDDEIALHVEPERVHAFDAGGERVEL